MSKPKAKLKILFTAANLPDQPLNLDEEHRRISAKVRASRYRRAIELLFAGALRPTDLGDHLNEHRPQVVHFSGHGKENEIILCGRRPLTAWRPGPRLGQLFPRFGRQNSARRTQCVLVPSTSRSDYEVIDFAVGMSRPVCDDTGDRLRRRLLLGDRLRIVDVQRAFDQAVATLGILAPDEADIPRLFARQGVDPSQVVLVPRRKPKKAKELCGEGLGGQRRNRPPHSLLPPCARSCRCRSGGRAIATPTCSFPAHAADKS